MVSFFPRQIESVAIIGGGAEGVAAANVIKKEGFFKKVKVFEKRRDAGGLWHYSRETQTYRVPVADPLTDQEPIRSENGYAWTSASYDLLETNVPTHFMRYSELPYGKDIPLYPHRTEVLKYVQRFAERVADIIEYGVYVYSLKQLANHQWEVKSRKVNEETQGGILPNPKFESTELFDAVIVVAGPYEAPYAPEKDGLREWVAKFPGSVTHSKTFRHPEQFKDIPGEVVVIGNGTSGIDISLQIASVRKVFKSVRSDSYLPAPNLENIRVVADVSRFEAETKSLVLADGSRIENVGHVIFATGYLRSFPFLNEFNSSTMRPLLTNGFRVHGVYHHTLSTYHPGLAFIGLTRFILPNRTAEVQALWLARVFANKVDIPSLEEQQKEEQYFFERHGDTLKFHDLRWPEDQVFFEILRREAYSKDKTVRYNLLEWTPEELAKKALLKEIREAFVKQRSRTGQAATTIEQLGLEIPPVDEETIAKIAEGRYE